MPTLLPELRRRALYPIRRLIDRVDDQLLWWMAGRRRLVAAAARIKQNSGTPMRDPAREAEVHARAQRLGRRLGLPAASIERLIDLLIDDACGQQRIVRG
ncbi:MAG TPA: chorismate mutase, partial [Dokdonella sp.]|nr:chorismate mutase [Dokdonella sp.]